MRRTGAGRSVLVAHPSADLYGSDRVLRETVVALVDGGWDVTVTLPGTGPLVDLITACGARVEIVPMVVVRRSMLSPRGMVAAARESATSLRLGIGLLRRVAPDAVVVNTVAVPMWLVLARALRVPVLSHVHEAESAVAAWKRGLLALPLLLADVVVANSRQTVAVLGSSFPSLARRASVVLNPVPGPPRPARARAALDPPLRVVYVGRLSPRKGVDVAVDAVARLVRDGVPARLDLVGAVFAGYEWYERELRAQVDRLGLHDRVTFHGFQPHVWEHLGRADVAVVPSRADESFGNAAVEALLAGRPVVVSAIGGLLEATAGYGAARAVTPDDPDALADALRGVVADWGTLAEAAWEDRGTAVDRHDVAVYRRSVQRLVGSLPTRSRRRSR